MAALQNKWATFDTSEFPVVNVKFSRNIDSEQHFEQFLNDWLELYEKKEDFTFNFDTTDVGLVNIKYAYKMSKFVKKLKRDYSIQYLKESTIQVSSMYVKGLLKLIFFLQEPVCPIYITKKINKTLNKKCG
jgi:hypothetical protein